MKELRLLFTEGPLRGMEFKVESTMNLGRYRDNDIVVSSPHVSRHHCRLMRSGDNITIQDLSSRNGTWVNGRKISMSAIMVGDKLKFGDVYCEIVEREGHGRTRPSTLTPRAAEALSSKPSVRDEGDVWEPSERFGGLESVKVRFRLPSGVLCRARHKDFGEVDVFIYLPGLCASTKFKRLARFEAQARQTAQVSGMPRLLDIDISDGVLMLIYEPCRGNPPRVSGEENLVAMLEALAQYHARLASAKRSHGCICPSTILRTEDGEYRFHCAGVLLDERAERDDEIPALSYDLMDLCASAKELAGDSGSGEKWRRAFDHICEVGSKEHGGYSSAADLLKDIVDLKEGRYDIVLVRNSS